MIDNRLLLDRLLGEKLMRMDRSPFLGEEPPAFPAPLDLDRVEGMLLGLAIGDALGNTSEGMGPGERRARHGEITTYLPNSYAGGRCVGTPSDDSQMAFWTLENLLADGGLVPDHLAACFSSRRIYGIGKSVGQFIVNHKDRGLPWERSGVSSAGNGAVMRIAPVLIPHLRAPSPAVWADAALAGMVTHNDPTSNACCVAFAALLWSALGLGEAPAPGWWLERFVSVAGALEGDTELVPRCAAHKGSFRGSLTRFVSTKVEVALAAGKTVREISDEFWSAAFLLETVPSVLAVLERHADSPREAILRAVNDTWDNDTVAAIVGAVVGALHGRKALPPEWVDGLLGRTKESDDGRVLELLAATRGYLGAPAAESIGGPMPAHLAPNAPAVAGPRVGRTDGAPLAAFRLKEDREFAPRGAAPGEPPPYSKRELKLTAALYASRSLVLDHVRTTGKLPAEFTLGGAHIGMRLLIERRGRDITLTPDEQLVFDAIVREGRLPGGAVCLLE